MPDAEQGAGRTKGESEENIFKALSCFFAICIVALAVTVGILYVRGEDYKKQSIASQKATTEAITLAAKYQKELDGIKKPNPFCREQNFTTSQNESNLSPFDDLTAREYKSAEAYLTRQLGLTTSDRVLNSSYVFLMDLFLPNKEEVLKYLKNEGAKPLRYVRAVVYRGDKTPPVVEEYRVGVDSTSLKLLKTVSWNKRPNDDVEMDAIDESLIIPLTVRLYPILKESFNGWYHNCTDRCLTYNWINPLHGERQWWFYFQRNLNNDVNHPLGLAVLLNVSSIDTEDWVVSKVVYNFQAFDTVDEFVKAYEAGSVTKLNVTWPTEFSTQKRRPRQPEHAAKMAPEMFEPEGKRFKVNGRDVEYLDWNFKFRVSTTKSLQLYDIKFRNERIAYELGAQETVFLNSGKGPISMHYQFLDTFDIRGWSTFELFRGVDCPRTAVFFDIDQYKNGAVKRVKNAVCIFELDAGIPLRRHYTQNYDKDGEFIEYGGLADHVLVIRTIVTMYNSDQIYDYIFHQNGGMEIKSTVSGYPFTTLYGSNEEEKKYAYQMHNEISAPVNQVLVHYKVDLDVQGTSNRMGRINFRLENVPDTWQGGNIQQYHVGNRFYAKNESVFPLILKADENEPGYFLFFNDVKRNAYNRHRAYRLQNESPTKVLLTPGVGVEPAISWSRYPIAVTKHRDDEMSSSSIYNGGHPSQPEVDFQSFIDGDKLDDEDLVAWVTMGAYVLPSTNDMPTQTTTGHQMKFLLLPYNYHDEDPSMSSSNSIYVTADGKVERYGTAESSRCVPPHGNDYKYDESSTTEPPQDTPLALS